MQNINNISILTSPYALTTEPIITPISHTYLKQNENILQKTEEPSIKLKNRLKRNANKEPCPDTSDRPGSFEITNAECKKKGKPNGYSHSVTAQAIKNDHICLPAVGQNTTLTAKQAIAVCKDVAAELKRVKLITNNSSDVKKYKEYCTHSLSQIRINGNETEINGLKSTLRTLDDDLDGIDIRRVKDFFDVKAQSSTKKSIKQQSTTNNSSTRLLCRFYCVAAFCSLSLYTIYMQHYGLNK